MNDCVTYAIFGCTLLLLGTIGVIIVHHYHWRQSKEKARLEYILFWSHLEEMGFDYKTIMEVAAQMKSMEDFESANLRIEKTKYVPRSKHKNEPTRRHVQ